MIKYLHDMIFSRRSSGSGSTWVKECMSAMCHVVHRGTVVSLLLQALGCFHLVLQMPTMYFVYSTIVDLIRAMSGVVTGETDVGAEMDLSKDGRNMPLRR